MSTIDRDLIIAPLNDGFELTVIVRNLSPHKRNDVITGMHLSKGQMQTICDYADSWINAEDFEEQLKKEGSLTIKEFPIT